MSQVIPLFPSNRKPKGMATAIDGLETATHPRGYAVGEGSQTYTLRVLEIGQDQRFETGRLGRWVLLGNWKHTARVIQYQLPDRVSHSRPYAGDPLASLDCYQMTFFREPVPHTHPSALFHNQPQWVLNTVQAIDPRTRGVELIPRSWAIHPEDLVRLVQQVSQIRHPALKHFLQAIFADPQRAYAYVRLGASQQYHHKAPGQLLSHSLDVAQKAVQIHDPANTTERDLLIVAGLLHDLAKVKIYAPDDGQLTDTGRALHHDSLTAELIAPYLPILDQSLADMLRNMLYPQKPGTRYPDSLLRYALKLADHYSAAKDMCAQAFQYHASHHPRAKDNTGQQWMRWVPG